MNKLVDEPVLMIEVYRGVGVSQISKVIYAVEQ